MAGILGNTYALIADGVESLLDIFGSFVVWFGLRVAAEPPDDEHPYGHGKAEVVAAIVGFFVKMRGIFMPVFLLSSLCFYPLSIFFFPFFAKIYSQLHKAQCNIATTTDEDSLRARLGESFTYKFAQGAKFYQTAEIASAVSDTDNYIFNFEAGIESTLSDNLKVRLSFLDRYVNTPPAGLEENDSQITSSIVLGF